MTQEEGRGVKNHMFDEIQHMFYKLKVVVRVRMLWTMDVIYGGSLLPVQQQPSSPSESSAPHAKFRLFSATFPPPDSLTQSPICRPGDWTSPFGSLGGLSPSAAPGVVGVSQDLRQGDADAQ